MASLAEAPASPAVALLAAPWVALGAAPRAVLRAE
jgi:hypothetical protein